MSTIRISASYIYLYYEYFYKNFYMGFKIEAKRSLLSQNFWYQLEMLAVFL